MAQNYGNIFYFESFHSFLLTASLAQGFDRAKKMLNGWNRRLKLLPKACFFPEKTIEQGPG
jgi:hypothetical protein